MYYYKRKLKLDNEVLPFESIDEAKQKALTDWLEGTFIPMHISDESGKQVVDHKELRHWLKDETGIGASKKYRKWQN